MRINITQTQIQFYRDHSYIEFEELIPVRQVDAIKEYFLPKFVDSPFMETYAACHDLFRNHDHLGKIILNPQLASIAAHLIHKSRLRIGFDQMIFSPSKYENLDMLPPMFKGIYNLSQISCIGNISCGLLINIDTDDPLPNFPGKSGSGLYFSRDYPIDFHEMITQPNQRYLLIAYALEKSYYMDQPLDPSNPTLKKLGYGFGDRLKHDTHPVLLF